MLWLRLTNHPRLASPKAHGELIQILGILTDGSQELGWYSHDLEEIAETADRMPGMRPGAQHHLDRCRRRVTRMRENGKAIREEANQANPSHRHQADHRGR
jgi:magnesium transporter